MKREIKFRGILKDAKIWVYGNLVYLKKPNKSYIVNIHNGLKEEVENESIGQFTGIYDKNGVGVYEGDIVNVDLGGEHRLMTVQFRDGYFGFGGEHLGAYYFDPFSSETIEVVDCIYNTK